MTGAILEARGLVKSYGATPALRGVDVSVREGEIVAVTGPSGSGKSTLLHCLSGILRPESGEVRYRGARLDTLTESRRTALRRGEFGVLFQFGQLVPELTTAENIALPLLLHGRRRDESAARARRWMERFGIDRIADRRPGELSGGQVQRVAMARALVTGPRVVFADEPTGALDTLAGERMLRAFLDAVRDAGTTVVLVTHDATVAAYGDREVVVRDGVVESAGEAA